MSGKFCPHCGAARVGAGKFCGGCGQVFQEQHNCPTCGQVLPPGVVLNNSPTRGKQDMAGTISSATVVTELGEASISDPRLVYGSGFSKSDCINCGSKRKASDKSCSLCSYKGSD
ncbi:MAG: hypothetical protein FJW46_05785 [Actinobacteria bacterium]|nr:hypothetical protein [Actinomycetota bacterium]